MLLFLMWRQIGIIRAVWKPTLWDGWAFLFFFPPRRKVPYPNFLESRMPTCRIQIKMNLWSITTHGARVHFQPFSRGQQYGSGGIAAIWESWFDRWLCLTLCRSVLEQDTEHLIAPNCSSRLVPCMVAFAVSLWIGKWKAHWIKALKASLLQTTLTVTAILNSNPARMLPDI